LLTPTEESYDIIPLQKLTKDIREAAKSLSPSESRYLVDSYYTIQEYRKATANQVRAMTESEEPSGVLEWFFKQHEGLENNIKRVLDIYTSANPVGKWAKGIVGIGPVISAGLLAHIDIHKAPTVGHIWRFAGLDATKEWLGAAKAEKIVKDILGKTSGKITLDEVVTVAARTDNRTETLLKFMVKKDKTEPTMTVGCLASAVARRPWNAKLKVLCWKIGQSFVKVSNNPKDYYGKVYKQRKEYEQAKNENGDYADQAERILATKKISKETEAYKWYSLGKLPPGHIQARSERYAVKLFLSHLHGYWYEEEFGTKPPLPYPIAILGHAHMIEPPK